MERDVIMSEWLNAEIKKKALDELERAKFRAYSDITADEQMLHGNVGTVVNLSEAKAIFKSLLDDDRMVVIEKKALQDLWKERPQPVKQKMWSWLEKMEKLLGSEKESP